MVSRDGHTVVICHFLGALSKGGQCVQDCSFVEFVGVARKFKYGKKSDDRNRRARVEKMKIHLRLSFLHHLLYVALYGFDVACRTTRQMACAKLTYSIVMSFNSFARLERLVLLVRAAAVKQLGLEGCLKDPVWVIHVHST